MDTTNNISSVELDAKLALAREMPGIAHVLLTVEPGKGPVCTLCGGRQAPIIDGKHLAPERFCEA